VDRISQKSPPCLILRTCRTHRVPLFSSGTTIGPRSIFYAGSSIGGLIVIPYQALYSASKVALEGMTESLRLEVRPFGIRVVIIEPGDTETEITQKSQDGGCHSGSADRSLAAALKRTADDEQGGPGPEGVARPLWRIVNTLWARRSRGRPF
jgi:NAD(P)-dependent dehydrogenase (short-subunit alcohol dehydrogenase family)